MRNYIKYFPGLNGLRFFAAILVFFHHVEQHKYWIGLPNLWMDPTVPTYPLIVFVIDNIGHQARVIFFVLSGFLVTYMFLAEKEQKGTINWKKFQIRRALRLYPVYFLVFLFSLLVLPHLLNINAFADPSFEGSGDFQSMLTKNFVKLFVLFALMLPNFTRLLPPVMGASQFWSVGVQEQFYLSWPLIIRWFSNKLLRFLIIFLILKFGIEIIMIQIIPHLQAGTTLLKVSKQFLQMWQLFQVEQMAVGAIGAYILFHEKQKIIDLIFKPVTHIITLAVFITLLFFRISFPGYTAISGFIALILILNISLNKKFYIGFDKPFLNYLGNLSFGMYAFHTVVLTMMVYYLKYLNLPDTNYILFNIIMYIGSLIVTLVLSILSYKYYEGFFQKLKEKAR